MPPSFIATTHGGKLQGWAENDAIHGIIALTLNPLEASDMSAFTPANLPSGVGTVEELVAWGVSALAQINDNNLVQTAAGQIEPVVSAQTFRFPFIETNQQRLICIAYLPLTANWRSGGKLWNNGIGEISNLPLPADFTTN